jgi:hypothetical protein
MKKLVAVTVVVALGLLGTMAHAGWQGYGPGYGAGYGPGGGQVDVNKLRQLQKETAPLRDEIAVKGVELRNEYAKQNPDQAQITKLRGEIGDLRTKIQAAAEKQGLPAWGYGPRGAGPGRGYGPRMMGYGYGRGPGYGRGYCPMW